MTHEGILLHESPQVSMNYTLARLSMTHEGILLHESPQTGMTHVLASFDTSVLANQECNKLQAVLCHTWLC